MSKLMRYPVCAKKIIINRYVYFTREWSRSHITCQLISNWFNLLIHNIAFYFLFLVSTMGDFKRSPSKVWWIEDNTIWSLQSSASPGSQDSGFSDTEIPSTQKNILRELSKDTKNDPAKTINSNELYKEKSITDKNLSFHTTIEKLSKTLQSQQIKEIHSPKPILYQKRTRKNLFKTDATIKVGLQNNQYAKDDNGMKSHQISSKVTFNSSNVSLQESITTASTQQRLNRSAPAVLGVLQENEERVEEGKDEHSDCDSEIENFFREAEKSPKYTSTPKAGRVEMRQCKRKAALNLHQARFQRERYVMIYMNNKLFCCLY